MSGQGPQKADLQAVVVIHGMGEQIPMDTIKAFVKAAWQTDRDITRKLLPDPAEVWSKPDERTGSLELRRITTRESIPSPEFPGGVRTDFYELYWADLTAGSTWDEFTNWVWYLLLRPLSRVPKDVRLAWALLWFASVAVALLVLATLVPAAWWHGWQWVVLAIAGLLTAGLHKLASQYFGRVVRYTRADPDNIAARKAVRERGLGLLRALHQGDYYRRIVIVSHSLGTILAHDLVSYFWAEREAARQITQGTPEFAALCELEAAAQLDHDPSEAALRRYHDAQRALRRALAGRLAPNPRNPQDRDRRWLISDLVTLGSPLTHAEFLLAASAQDLRARKDARELPESPPYRERLDPNVLARAQATPGVPIEPPPNEPRLMSYPIVGSKDEWELHHAAPFAVVRWTNLYDPAKWVFFGDLIGGPLRNAFGPAIIDVDLKRLNGGRQSWSFTHTKYWTVGNETEHNPRLVALRKAVNLLDRPNMDPNRP